MSDGDLISDSTKSSNQLGFRMNRRVKIGALIVMTIAVAIDQSSKWYALGALRRAGGHVALSGPIDFTLSFNESNAFGLVPIIAHATRWFLMAANLAVAILILYVIATKNLRPLALFGLTLIMAGAVGNAIDRLLIGAVVDFMDATKIGFPWIFNVADATLDAGIGLLLWNSMRSERQIMV